MKPHSALEQRDFKIKEADTKLARLQFRPVSSENYISAEFNNSEPKLLSN